MVSFRMLVVAPELEDVPLRPLSPVQVNQQTIWSQS